MILGLRRLLSSPRSVQPAGGPAPAAEPPMMARLPARLTTAGMFLLAAWLIFLIKYHHPILPYLLLTVLAASLWRLRAGVLCLAASLAVITVTVLGDPEVTWPRGLRYPLALTLLGLVCIGARAVLDGLERQRRRELRLIAELSAAVEQLRESERQQALAAQALAERNHLLRTILDAVDNGIFLADAEGRVRFANERLQELLDLEVGELVGQDATAAILAPLADRQIDAAPSPVALPTSGLQAPSRYLIELVRPTTRLLYQYSTPVRDDAGRVAGCLYVYSDLPDWERLQELLEERVAERTAELEAAQEQLLRSARLAAVGQFSATVAHELRNPLNVVKLSVHYVTTQASTLDEKLQRSISNMNRHVDRACDIINDLLTYSRLPAPKLRPAAVNHIVREAIGGLAVSDRVAVELSLAPDLPLVMVDARQIEQAISNLGLNAVQAMAEGGRLTVRTYRGREHVEITVRDTGPGIPEALRERIFEPFYSTKPNGTGLGLPLVREIADAHGGRFTLESAPGEGACFTLTLPLEATAQHTEAPNVHSPSVAAG